MELKIKRLTETATLPTKAHETDACFDIYADIKQENVRNIIIPAHESVTLHTGFCTEIPEGYFAPVFCRSGMGIKRHLRLSNSVGIIDSHYRGEWMVALHNDGEENQIICHGDRIAQFTLLPVLDVTIQDVDEVDSSDRGDGGFGSTGH